MSEVLVVFDDVEVGILKEYGDIAYANRVAGPDKDEPHVVVGFEDVDGQYMNVWFPQMGYEPRRIGMVPIPIDGEHRFTVGYHMDGAVREHLLYLRNR